MLSNAHRCVRPRDEAERAYLESFVRDEYARIHPGDTLALLKERAAFSKEDKGQYREWLAFAATRATAAEAARQPLDRAA